MDDTTKSRFRQTGRLNSRGVVGHGGDGISLRFKSSALDFPKDLASGGYLPAASVALSLASGERAPGPNPGKTKAPPPSRSEKRNHPV